MHNAPARPLTVGVVFTEARLQEMGWTDRAPPFLVLETSDDGNAETHWFGELESLASWCQAMHPRTTLQTRTTGDDYDCDELIAILRGRSCTLHTADSITLHGVLYVLQRTDTVQ